MPLIVVPTPVGNLEDITLRAIRVLREADWIACEDTRRTLRLLNHLGIRAPLVSSHEHNERERAPALLKALREGKRVALVTDAGTPAISDPGAFIVGEAIREGIEVEVLPGATAFVPALVLSGLPIQTFQFAGFLPPRKGERKKRLLELKDVSCTLVFYVSPHRLYDDVEDCARILGNRPCALVRELSKVHEEVLRMNLEELRERVRSPLKGEMVLVVAGAPPETESPEDGAPESWEKTVEEAVEEGLSGRDVVKMVHERYGIPKNRIKAYLIEKTSMGRKSL
ncbi:MAG: 16S rRNA (cytidine(1402)-2'-O)-methyltransferase [Synergistaceae bacterium]|nr:16S rRNA (cytidine(1402)-2'-O)-methyltransferase [Synergistaceae bacterium]